MSRFQIADSFKLLRNYPVIHLFWNWLYLTR